MRYLIIGNGGAGLRAAQTLRRRDARAKITMVDRESYPCYYRMRLPDYISGWKTRDTVFVVNESFYKEQGIELLRENHVVSVRPKDHVVQLDNGDLLGYDRLLIAAGARPRRLPCPGSDLEGVVYLRTLDQAEEIISRTAKARGAVALGGGLLGVEMARAFKELGLDTHYLIREDRFWPQMLDSTGSLMIENVLAEKGIQLHKEEGMKEIHGDESGVKGVLTTTGHELPADLVGVAIGVVCNIEFLEGSGIATDRGVIVDDHLQTNLEGVYAAGDVAQAYDVVHGDHRVVTSWLNTQRQGEAAAVNMSGGDAALGGVVPYNVIVIYGLPVACIGINLPPENEGFKSLTGDYPKSNEYRKLVLRDGVLVGAILIGNIGEAKALETLIKSRIDVSAYRDRLFEPGFDAKALLAEIEGHS
jgi:nitrite reductase (NADH) large subunit